MHVINPQSLKKLLLSLGLSIFIIIIFLILKMFLQEEREGELKSFKNSSAVELEKSQEETQKEGPVKEKDKEEKFLLLPSK